MNIVGTEGDMKYHEIFDGRNSEWFENLQGYGWRSPYDSLCIKPGIPENSPKEIEDAIEAPDDYGYYGFNYIGVKDFKEWFDKKRPDIDAGWLSTYEKWLYEKKGVFPTDIAHYLDHNCNLNDYHFVEVVDPYDCSAWLRNFIDEHNDIMDDDYISYYFDC